MSTHDSITRYGPGRTWRAPWRLAWRLLRACVPWRRAAARPVRLGRRGRRRLSAIERALTVETPQLASMFQMFAQLAVGESHDGAERLPRSVRSLPRPRRAHLALLFAFASLVALCVTLSFRVTPSPRNCPASTTLDVVDVARLVSVARVPCRGSGRLRADAHGRLPRVPC